MNLAVVVVAVLVGATGAPDEVGGGNPVFTRVEPHLAAGARALQAGDPDLALERFRRAEATTDEQRAVVEYNAGQAVLLQAMNKAKADAAAAPPADAGQAPAPPTPPTPPDITDALASFERAAALGRAPSFVSEARLAAGNAALVGNKLDDAIAQFRKALVAEPRNDRARHNLQRALELKQQQPEQPPQDGDGEGSDDKKQDGDKKDGDQDKKDGAQQGQKDDAGEQNKPADEKNSDDTKPDEQKQDDAKNGDKNDKKDAEQKPGDGKDDGDKGDDGKKDGEPNPAPTPKKPTSKEEARRLLEGIRSRERPLSPIEMRGTERRPAENGKDW